MSISLVDGPRLFCRSASARTFPETYYNERHAATENPRIEPYAYPMGGPVSGLRNRTHTDRDEFQPEQGNSRRRIAVACARCRKRKIRCSGDSVDGGGCQNCRAAGVDASQCQFHRVGSDHVETVMDSYNMVQSLTTMAAAHNMMSLYSAGGDGPYHRSPQIQPYPQLDTKFAYPQLDVKPAYGSDWTSGYEDDTSPTEDYSFEQSSSYLPTTPATASHSSCSLPYRWMPQTVRTNQPTTNYYSDYDNPYMPNGVPYLQTEIPPVVPVEPMSPLNMSSLQLTLPERPRQRPLQPTEIPVTPRRRLPAPQPGHRMHHALDHQQDQRLRSSQTIGTPVFKSAVPAYNDTGSFGKPLLPWTAANENLMNACAAMPPSPEQTEKSSKPRASANVAKDATASISAGRNVDETSNTMDASSSNDLNFNTLPLLDPSLLTTPAAISYSNFRESRDPVSPASSAQLSRDNSSSSLYTYDGVSRRPSFPADDASSNLVSGHRYTPLSQPADTTVAETSDKILFKTRNIPLHRASTSSLSSSL